MATWIVGGVLLVIVGAVIWKMIKDKKSGNSACSCGGDCGMQGLPLIFLKTCQTKARFPETSGGAFLIGGCVPLFFSCRHPMQRAADVV